MRSETFKRTLDCAFRIDKESLSSSNWNTLLYAHLSALSCAASYRSTLNTLKRKTFIMNDCIAISEWSEISYVFTFQASMFGIKWWNCECLCYKLKMFSSGKCSVKRVYRTKYDADTVSKGTASVATPIHESSVENCSVLVLVKVVAPVP